MNWLQCRITIRRSRKFGLTRPRNWPVRFLTCRPRGAARQNELRNIPDYLQVDCPARTGAGAGAGIGAGAALLGTERGGCWSLGEPSRVFRISWATWFG